MCVTIGRARSRRRVRGSWRPAGEAHGPARTDHPAQEATLWRRVRRGARGRAGPAPRGLRGGVRAPVRRRGARDCSRGGAGRSRSMRENWRKETVDSTSCRRSFSAAGIVRHKYRADRRRADTGAARGRRLRLGRVARVDRSFRIFRITAALTAGADLGALGPPVPQQAMSDGIGALAAWLRPIYQCMCRDFSPATTCNATRRRSGATISMRTARRCRTGCGRSLSPTVISSASGACCADTQRRRPCSSASRRTAIGCAASRACYSVSSKTTAYNEGTW